MRHPITGRRIMTTSEGIKYTVVLIERAWDEGYEYAKGQRSPLVSRVEALEQVQRVEHYLFAVTYVIDGRGSRTWLQWYADMQDAVQKLRESELLLRQDIARRIGATLVDKVARDCVNKAAFDARVIDAFSDYD